jgi:hypothetical protein
MNLLTFYAAVALIALASTQATAQDFDKGYTAYAAGDYQTAFKEWAPWLNKAGALSNSI